MEKVDLLGVELSALRLDELLALIRAAADGGGRRLIAHANITGLNLAYKLPWMRAFYNRADVVYADGMGVLLGARLLGRRLPERYTLADWVWPLAGQLAAHSHSVFLLGSAPGVAERAAAVLQARCPALRIAGTHDGFFDHTPGSAANAELLAQIDASGAQVLLVALGMPLQEAWLDAHWAQMNVPVAITVGALFEYINGDLRRGPAWMTGHYLEWLARALISPRRYARRYLRDIPLFAWRVLKQRVGL